MTFLEVAVLVPLHERVAMRDLHKSHPALGESAAICAYIADRYPQTGLAPEVNDPLRAKYLQWLFFSPSCIEPALIQLFTKIEVPSSTAAWGSATQVFDLLDASLQKGPWILGDKFSAADILIGTTFAMFMGGPTLPKTPLLESYIKSVVGRPAYARAMTKDAS